MDFDTLIQWFKDWSGRHDLEDETIVYYLNSGQRFLDDLTDHSQTASRYIYAGTVGLSYLSLTAQAKVINHIDLIKDEEVFHVYEIPLHELQILSTTLPSFKSNSLPEYFALANQRKVSSGALPSVDQGHLAIIETGTKSNKLGILFECPLDQTYTVDIYGKFYSSDIVEGVDPDTIWAIQYPFTLLHSALYKLEISNRNTEGAKDWLASMQTDLGLIDKNVAEQTSNNINEMRG
jgi:hypothetical protein